MAENTKKITYEQAMKRLEEIVSVLEAGKLGLEESLKLFEEGTSLASFCNKTLNDAEQKIVKTCAEKEVENNE